MTTPQTAQPASPVHVPHDKIAMRAYEKWVKKGRPNGSNEQDWLEAEIELKAEYARGVVNPAQATQRR
jgi:hypothetical protein